MLPVILRIALLTGMRVGEIQTLRWSQVNFDAHVVTVGRAKTSCGTGRQVPMGRDLQHLLQAHRVWFTAIFNRPESEHYLFPWGTPSPVDPTRCIGDIKKAWGNLKKRTGVRCRFHDLRHTAATKMAEAGVPESTMLAILGHMSRSMLERYSHVRMTAKRTAIEVLNLVPKSDFADGVPTKVPTNGTPVVLQ